MALKKSFISGVFKPPLGNLDCTACQFCSLDYQPNLSPKPPIIMGFCLHRHCQFSCWLLCSSFRGLAHKSRAKRAPGLKTKSGECLKGRIAFKLSTINQSEWQLRESQTRCWRSEFWKLLQPWCTYENCKACTSWRERVYIISEARATEAACRLCLLIFHYMPACYIQPGPSVLQAFSSRSSCPPTNQ